MNTNTGEIREWDALTEQERQSGEWVKVSDDLARASLEAQIADKIAAIRELAAEKKGAKS